MYHMIYDNIAVTITAQFKLGAIKLREPRKA